MKTISMLKAIIPVEQSMTDRWDREWLNYFLAQDEDARVFYVPYDQLNVTISLAGRKAADVFTTNLCASRYDWLVEPLKIWTDGDDLVNKNVLEIGCGPGYLGKQIGLVAKSYIGIDYSKLALYIAFLTSPGNCHYYHLSELDAISKHAVTMDTMVGREFFIHQNFQNTIWLLELAMLLLRPCGLVCADFYLGNPAIPQGVIHPAKSSLDPTYPSCGFQFEEQEILEVAKEVGFAVEKIIDQLDLQRRFVHFRKP